MKITQLEWVKDELSTVSLGDKRRDQRLIDLTIKFALNSESSIRHAMDDHNNTIAAYRFFRNPKVSPENILAPHITKTNARIAEHEVVVAIHDTVSFDFSDHHKMVGLGIIGGQEKTTGLVAHHCLAVNLNGVPLGILTQKVIARKNSKLSYREYPDSPIEQKETYRWIEGLLEASVQEETFSKAIHVCDREADFFEFLEKAIEFNHRFVVRMRWNRSMGEKKKLKDVLKNQAMKKALVTVVIEGNSDRAQREVECELCAASLQVPGPSRSKKKRDKTLNLNCVWVQEKKESDDEKLEWILWTNEPIETEENVIKVLQYYRLRPLIEEFHKILKSGLKVEDCCLGSADKFARFLALKSILAWRLFLICRVGRHNGDLSCEFVFSRMEWQILWVRRKKNIVDPLV
jgi:hypothetical protein